MGRERGCLKEQGAAEAPCLLVGKSAEFFVQPLDPVDRQVEIRSGLEVGLVERAVKHGLLGVGGEVAVGVQGEGGFQFRTPDGESAGVSIPFS